MITFDAQNQILGRLGSKIASTLMGKHKPDYVPYKNTGEAVEVLNIDMLKISGDKMEQKVYYHHTLYPGHLKKEHMKDLTKAELLRRAVWNMLPKNKLREGRMRLLTIKK